MELVEGIGKASSVLIGVVSAIGSSSAVISLSIYV